MLVAMDLGVAVLPNFMKDNTDRNRTSPFAFTGNKFEFRMPGSSVNLSDCEHDPEHRHGEEPEGLCRRAWRATKATSSRRLPLPTSRRRSRDHQRIIFNGNGYSEEWEAEAETPRPGEPSHHRRSAAVLRRPEDASTCSPSSTCFPRPEVRSRYEVKLEKYNKLLNIEARTMIRMARRTYLPAITDYMADLASNITTVKAAVAGADMTETEKVLEVLISGSDKAAKATRELIKVHNAAEDIEDPQEQANAYANTVIPAMDALRAEIDALECVVERDYWPVPTYNDILFYA